jgi:hypothetical protein
MLAAKLHKKTLYAYKWTKCESHCNHRFFILYRYTYINNQMLICLNKNKCYFKKEIQVTNGY